MLRKVRKRGHGEGEGAWGGSSDCHIHHIASQLLEVYKQPRHNHDPPLKEKLASLEALISIQRHGRSIILPLVIMSYILPVPASPAQDHDLIAAALHISTRLLRHPFHPLSGKGLFPASHASSFVSLLRKTELVTPASQTSHHIPVSHPFRQIKNKSITELGQSDRPIRR